MGRSQDITDIKDQALSLLLADFHICQHCHIVDRDSDRIMVGLPCSNCGTPSPSGRTYFNMSVHSLIDLMQEFFHKDYTDEGMRPRDGLPYAVSVKKNSKVAVVIFFVILRKVLLENLLYDLMIAQGLPADVCKRLFADSPMHKQRMDKLFPSLARIT